MSKLLERPLAQPVTQVCEHDTIEVSINFSSLQGMVALDSIEWFEPHVSTPTTKTVLDYDKD
jgi:hypothetical protein